jgi:hypothetical protein
MNSLDDLIAQTQRNLSYFDRVLFAVILILLGLTPLMGKPYDEWLQNILLIMVGALIGHLTNQNQFWFMRQRVSGVPDPTATTTTTTTPNPAIVRTTTTGEPNETTTVTTTAAAPAAGGMHEQPVQDRRDAGTDG